NERLDAVEMRPDVVEDDGVGAAHGGKMLEQPGLASVDGALDVAAAAPGLDEGGDGHGSDGGVKGMVGAGDGSVDRYAAAQLRTPPGAVLVLVLDQERHAALDGRVERSG